MPFRHVYAFLFVTAILAPTFLFSQGPGGGDSGKGGGGFKMTIDPEKMWKWVAKDKDSINLDEMNQFQRAGIENILTKYGVTSRTVSKQQYLDAYTKFNDDVSSGKVDVKSMFAPKEGSGGFGGFGKGGGDSSKGSGEFGKGSSESGKGGRDERTSGGKDEKRGEEKKSDRTKQLIEWRFKSYDKDGDGLLSHDEIAASENLAPLLADKAKFDKNSDSFISLEEYTVYAEAVIEAKQKEREKEMAENGGGDKPKEGSTDKAAGTEFEKPKMEEEKRATVQRSGKLPSGLPEWFATIDGKGDSDGQIGLYEWRAHSGKSLDEFLSMDLNNDGFITPSEYFRFKGIADTTVVRGKPLEDPSLAKGMGMGMGGFTRIGMGGGFGMGGTASMGMGMGGNGWGFNGGMGMGMGDRTGKGGFGGFGKDRGMGMGMTMGTGSFPMGMGGGTMGMGMGMGERPSKGGFGGFGKDRGMGTGMGMGTPPSMGMGTPPGMGTMGMGMGDRPSKGKGPRN